jgi:hypothetical protein
MQGNSGVAPYNYTTQHHNCVTSAHAEEAGNAIVSRRTPQQSATVFRENCLFREAAWKQTGLKQENAKQGA